MRPKLRLLCFLSVFSILAFGFAFAAEDPPETTAPEKTVAPATPTAGAATLKAVLISAEIKAKKKAATVEVDVTGLKIVDPALVNEQPKPGQGHIHYRLDDGPIIATTAKKLSFHELTPGEHKIVVSLAANDHTPLGPEETLVVTIP